MSFQEKNVAVSLGNFSLILVYFVFRVWQMLATESFEEPAVFRLWLIVIIAAILVTIFATILTHIFSAIVEAVRTGVEPEDIDDTQDERDKLIDLRGTQATYIVSSTGIFLAMLTYAFGQPALVMFTLLIFVGVAAQVVGDVYRLRLYRRGF